MTDILNYIISQYTVRYPDYKFWGLAEIITKAEDRFPVLANPVGGNRPKVCLDEAYDCVVWFREISANQTANEDYTFGLDEGVQMNVVLRAIVAYKVDLGEDFKWEFIQAFPEVDIIGYDFLDTVPGSVNLDHEAVAQEEQIHTQYNQHRICWNIFSFDTDIQFIPCPLTSP